MLALHRHQLARLTPAGWSAILARPWDVQARECLGHWATHELPLVVTRQANDVEVALGLSSPQRWGRRRLALQVPRAAVACLLEFPQLADVRKLLPDSAQGAVGALMQRLHACHAAARVFGSYGWQAITALDHVRPESDLDVSIAVDGPVHADAVTQVLQRFDAATPRLDGELVFGGGAAVAWREWAAWRDGHTRAVLVKQLSGACLQHDAGWELAL
ncbi:MAG TPA: malonate decarboxylase holo-[acyl-carrier-protein] synthase [Ramlibacter sp.]|nr:malonate decarboxylase holo-[acyl-carrier-protein] synthase [Ramlibacter sp.]